jgi:hypothetical protein
MVVLHHFWIKLSTLLLSRSPLLDLKSPAKDRDFITKNSILLVLRDEEERATKGATPVPGPIGIRGALAFTEGGEIIELEVLSDKDFGRYSVLSAYRPDALHVGSSAQETLYAEL